MKQLDLSRPDVLFGLVWISTTLLAFVDLYEMGISNTFSVSALIIFNVVSFFGIYALVKAKLLNKNTLATSPVVGDDFLKLTKITYVLSVIWFLIFIFIVYKNHGVPVLWYINHIQKSYVDFGIPTLSGFANALRTFIFCLSILLFIKTKNRYMVGISFLMFLFSLLELARGNTIYLVLCGVSVILLNLKINLFSKNLLLKLAVFLSVFVVLFGIVEKIRTPELTEEEKLARYVTALNQSPPIRAYFLRSLEDPAAEISLRYPTYQAAKICFPEEKTELPEETLLTKMPHGFKSTYLYVTTPVSNLYYADIAGIQPLYYPYFSLQVVVPTIVRTRLFGDQPYPIKLRSPAYNATTFYSPLIADFGFFGAGIFVFLLQIVVSYVHIRAKQGLWSFQLIYAPLFTSVALSFFYTYIISPSVLIFSAFVFIVSWATGVAKLKTLPGRFGYKI